MVSTKKKNSKKKNSKWIQGAIKNKGALRKKAGVKKGQNIPESTLDRLSKSSNPKTRRQANVAKTLRNMKKKKKKKGG